MIDGRTIVYTYRGQVQRRDKGGKLYWCCGYNDYSYGLMMTKKECRTEAAAEGVRAVFVGRGKAKGRQA